MLVGISLGVTQKEGVDWTKFQLPDGRKIGIASTDAKKAGEIARKFLVSEKAADRSFMDEDRIQLDGVRVAFLDPWDQDPLATSPWLTKQRDWTWTLLFLCLGAGLYLVMRALGWVIDGFLTRSEE